MVSERLLRPRQILGVGCLIFSAVCAGPSASRTPDLSKLGYSLLPEPQLIELTGAEFLFAPDWELQLTGVAEDHVAVRTLRGRLAEEFGVDLPLGEGVDEKKVLQLEISPGVAAQGQKEELAQQGYVLDTASQRIVIKGNAGPGLLFGVQTFLQLLGSREEASLPSCHIEDWPDLELRVIHWCEKEHQSRFNTLKEYLDRAAEYKINAIAWHLENTFQYKRHPVISTPYAFTREEVRELEEYANERYIELIPMLDFPSHMSYVLKHPEYAHLRELPERSYSICPTNEESWKLLFDMFDELLAAFHGKYFLFSTDELFDLGKGPHCGCAAKVKSVGESGFFVELTRRAGCYLEERGKRVMFWGESPLEVADIPKLPSTLIDAVAGTPTLEREGELETEKRHGMQVLIYYSTKGGEKLLFPDYFPFSYHKIFSRNHLENMYQRISYGKVRENDVLGTFIAGWDDHGPNLEVIWLGLVTGSSYGWHAGLPTPEEIFPRFINTFYGHRSVEMDEVFRLMNDGSLFWTFSWNRKRGIELPNLPEARTLDNRPFWKARYSRQSYTKDAHLDHLSEGPFEGTLRELTREKELVLHLIELLNQNLQVVEKRRYNVEVMLAIAVSYLHNIRLFETLGQIEDILSEAHRVHGEGREAEAVSLLEKAEKMARDIAEQRETPQKGFADAWMVSRFPSEQMDIFGREEQLDLDEWADDLRNIRGRLARP